MDLHTGLILFNNRLAVIAHDNSAASMFAGATSITDETTGPLIIPQELTDIARASISSDDPVRRILWFGCRQYMCYAHRVDMQDQHETPATLIAVHLRNHRAVKEAMDEVSHTYSLTEREQEVLIGLSSMGLTNKELAQRMKISQNTVKLFVRLMMIKMGVTTRTALVAKIMQIQPDLESRPQLKKAL